MSVQGYEIASARRFFFQYLFHPDEYIILKSRMLYFDRICMGLLFNTHSFPSHQPTTSFLLTAFLNFHRQILEVESMLNQRQAICDRRQKALFTLDEVTSNNLRRSACFTHLDSTTTRLTFLITGLAQLS